MFVLGMCTIQWFGEWFSIGFIFDDFWDDNCDNYDNSQIINKFEGDWNHQSDWHHISPYSYFGYMRCGAIVKYWVFFEISPVMLGGFGWLMVHSFAVWIPSVHRCTPRIPERDRSIHFCRFAQKHAQKTQIKNTHVAPSKTYPLVMTNTLLLKMVIYSGFTHWNWWIFHSYVNVYQRLWF